MPSALALGLQLRWAALQSVQIESCREGPAINIREPDECRVARQPGGSRCQCYRGGGSHRSPDSEGARLELVVGIIVREGSLWQRRESSRVVVRDRLLVAIEQIGRA